MAHHSNPLSPRPLNLLGGLAVAALMSRSAALFLRAPEAQGSPLRTGLVYHEAFLEHDTGKNHPERPARLATILRRLKETGRLPTLALLEPSGFDAHEEDRLGGMRVAAQGSAQMTSVVREIGEESCHGRLVSVLEGGYDLEGLAESVAARIAMLQQPPKKPNKE